MTTPFPFTSGQVLTAAQMNDITVLPINDQTDDYTLVAGDNGKRVIMNKATANTVTVDDSVFGVGDSVFIANKGAGVSTITAGAGVTINSASGLDLVTSQGGQLVALSASSFLFVASDTTVGESVAFTPSYISGYTRGNGTVDARYIQIGKLVYLFVIETLGSTSSIAQPRMTLPIAGLNASVITRTNIEFRDVSGGTSFYGVTQQSFSADDMNFGLFAVSGTRIVVSNISATVPFTWTTNDFFRFQIVYEAA